MASHLVRCGAIACAALAFPMAAAASCGADFCSINTSWNAEGAWTASGMRAGLRHEYLRQDEPRSGSRKVAVGELARHHDEVSTTNRNWIGSLDYALSEDWVLGVTLPLADRRHFHIHNHQGAPLPQSWDFTRLGDARVMAHGRAEPVGLDFGLKLPTGAHDVRNPEGTLAERSLQPGTGTLDVLLGAHTGGALRARELSWFAQALAQWPLAERDAYRPGRRFSLDLGARYDATERLGLLAQLNAVYRSRDRGAQAEPEDSGGKALYVAPGVAYSLSESLQAYGFLQLPLYQYVNGVQLTASRAVVLGLSARF